MATGKFHSRSKNVKFKQPGDHEISECNHRLNDQYIHYKPKNAKEGKEIVTVDDMSGQRTLIVPSRDPLETPGIWSKAEMERLKKQATVITMEQKMAMLEEEERKKIKLQQESDARKEMLKKAQVTKQNKQGSKLHEVETEATRKNLYLQQRAIELRQEQEEEIKQLNSLILATKCMAIRDAQIAEKELIKKQMEEEEHRLDMMMEQKRQKEMKEEEEKKKKENEENDRYVKEVQHQMKENELQRIIEAERMAEEARLINKAMVAIEREEAEKLEKKKQDQLKMREELRIANEEIENFKRIQKEEDRIADMRIKEFMRKKQEREDAREAEILAQNQAKEREIARLRGMQEKAQDQKAILDEMNAARIQEEVEKAWREKEKENAIKRKKQLEELRLGRQKQIDDIRRAQAMELERDEQEFHEVNKVQIELHEKELEKKEKRKLEAVKHRKELLKQIDEKERERINVHQEKYEEGNALRIEKELRDLNVKNVLKRKLDKLKETNLPDKYINDIARQATQLIGPGTLGKK